MPESPPKQMKRKQRERLNRRNGILEAARSVFAQKGYEHATIEEIAERAEFSKGALYNYFSNKEEMFLALLEEGFAEFERQVETSFLNKRALRGCCKQFARLALQYFEENPEDLTIIFKENLQMKIKLLGEFRERFAHRRERLGEIIAKPLRDGMKKKNIRKIDPVQLVEVFWNIIFAFLLHNRLSADKNQLEEDAEAIVTIFFDGIALR